MRNMLRYARFAALMALRSFCCSREAAEKLPELAEQGVCSFGGVIDWRDALEKEG